LVAGAVFFAACSRPPVSASGQDAAAAPAVGVVKLTRQDLSSNLDISAEFRPFQEIDVHAKVAGYVKAIHVDVGDRVKEGQLLATLEIPELQDEVAEATAAVKRSEEEIKRAQGELDRAEAARKVTHLAYTRLEGVFKTKPGLVAQQEVDDAQGRDLAADAQIDADKAALAASQQQLEVSKATLEKTRSMFAYAQITAPFTGVITRRYADTGAMLPAGTNSSTQSMPLVKLSQNNLLRLIIPVPESVVPKIHLRTPVEVRVQALGKSFQGVVARFADKVDLTTRTMDTEIDVPNPQLELVPGMYAEASISLEQRKDVVALPLQALNRQGGQATVFRVGPDSTIEERRVTLGMETPTQIEVLSGLQAGDLVVVSGQSQLRPGQKVEPRITPVPVVRQES
jgi:RND family efflux transporter MFP subunit